MGGRFVVVMLVICTALPASAVEARVALQDDQRIESGLTVVAIGKILSEACSNIRPRYLRALTFAQSLQKRARDLGYSDDEIDAYLDSDTDKDRVTSKARHYLRTRGADFNQPETLCAVGVREITGETTVGKFLRRK